MGRVMRTNSRAIVEVVNIFVRCQGLGVPRLVLTILVQNGAERERYVKNCDV